MLVIAFGKIIKTGLLQFWGHYVTQCGVGVGVKIPGKSIMKVYCSTLLGLRGGGRVSNFLEKSVT